jgi:hypothetical protein
LWSRFFTFRTRCFICVYIHSIVIVNEVKLTFIITDFTHNITSFLSSPSVFSYSEQSRSYGMRLLISVIT